MAVRGHEINQKQVLETVKHILDVNKYDEIASTGREYVKNNDWKAITDKFEKAMNELL